MNKNIISNIGARSFIHYDNALGTTYIVHYIVIMCSDVFLYPMGRFRFFFKPVRHLLDNLNALYV